MKRYLKTIYDEKEHDGFVFILDDKEELDVAAFTYEIPEEPIESNDIGLKYHIITYKELVDGGIIDLDFFEAIIGNPWHYIGGLIECGFFGIICKKTQNSYKLVKSMIDDLSEDLVDDEDDLEVQGV